MGLYARHILPHVIDRACRHEDMFRARQAVVPQARGRVLEVGFGTGLNLSSYEAGQVERLWALEPHWESMQAVAQKRLRNTTLEVEVIAEGAAAIPMPADFFDSVVMTFTLCSIHEGEQALEEIRRVMKPGACMLFAEHGLEGASVRLIAKRAGYTAGAIYSYFAGKEAIYAELHANFAALVREGFERRVWIVSPTTCMATLNTMRAILKDARMREQAGAIRKTLKMLHRDVEIVVERVGKLNTHFGQARADLEGLGTAAERAGKRAARLDNFDFEELAPEPGEGVVRLAPKNG